MRTVRPALLPTPLRLTGLRLTGLRLTPLRLTPLRLTPLRLTALRPTPFRLPAFRLPAFRLPAFQLPAFQLAAFRLAALRLALLLTPLWLAPAAQAELYYLIVGGLGGEPAYANRFLAQTETLADAAARSLGGDARVTLLNGEGATREALTEALQGLAETVTPADTLAVFLVGHGTYDGIAYKYNLPGRDLDGEELAELLGAVPAGRQLVVNTTSASGAVLESWEQEGRTLITATRSGGERIVTRFAEHWTAALSSESADTNRNGIITAREAFDYTERMVAESYENEGTLATEHPQLTGEPAESFTAARLAARVALTRELERMFAELDDLEGQVQALRARRNEMESDVYLNELQALLLELALVQQRIDDARVEE